MSVQIPLSVIQSAHGTAEEYAAEIAKHVDNLNAWHDHHDNQPDDHPHKYPYPNPHAVVHQGVKRRNDGTWYANYEIVDDVTTALFERKKDALHNAVINAEEKAAADIFPIRKRRLWNMRLADINAAEAEKLKTLSEEEVKSQRTKDDDDFIRDQELRRAALDKIHRHTAQMLSEIEDLTSETIDVWKPSPLRGEVNGN